MVYRKWTDDDILYIKNNYHNMTDNELASKLSSINNTNITVAMIRNKRRQMSVKKSRGRQKIKHTELSTQ